MTDWRNMPGPGDPETWGPCTNHPNDPRTPDNTARWEETKQKLWAAKMRDPEMFIETINDIPLDKLTAWLVSLGPHDNDIDVGIFGCRLGKAFYTYCEPSDLEVEEQIEREDEPDDRV